jgi:hypothetical protein
MKFFVVEPCASANAYEIKLRTHVLDLKKAETALAALGTVAAATPAVLLAKIDGYTVSVYASGRLLVKGVRRLESKEVNGLAERLMSALEKADAVI